MSKPGPKKKGGRPATGRQPHYSLSVRSATYQRMRSIAKAKGTSINRLLVDMLDREAQLALDFTERAS